jgi:hypothetical protein
MALKAITTTGGAGQYASLTAARTLATVVGTIPTTATHLWIECEAQNVRYRLDGTDPTAAIGLRLVKDGNAAGVWLTRAQWKNAKFIEETATAKLNWQFYKT